MTTLHDQWTALYAAGRVRWMAGMSTNIGARILRVSHAGTDMQHMLVASDHGAVFFVGDVDSDERPDFADPATIGCLLHQAREAWGDPGLHAARVRVKAKGQGAFRCWRIFNTVGDRTVNGSPDFYGAPDSGGWYTPYDSEPAAILAAIAAAPPKVKP
jgi:hypothetical protein